MSRNSLSSIRWLNHLKNYEKAGIPRGAGKANSTTWNLEQMHSLLAFLNNPHTTLKNVIHIVGTKGKGSVAVMLDSVLQAAGYHVGRYTSPHLVCEGERISIGGKPMSSEGLGRLVDTNKAQLERALEALPGTSFFEAFTALAIRHFSDSDVDWAIMEAGLGGVSDATNVFRAEQVRATVITALEEEHLEALGGSLQSIAAAKAGIVHPGTLAVIASQPHPDAADALQAALQSIPDVRSVWVPRDVLIDQGAKLDGQGRASHSATAGSILFPALSTSSLQLSMLGSHNVQNAGATITAVAEMMSDGAVHVPQEALQMGLQRARLPGRFDIHLRSSPGTCWICLDTAHTVKSCEALVRTALHTFPKSRSRAIIVGLAADKDMKGVVRSLATLRPSLILCVATDSCGLGERGQPAEEVCSAFRSQFSSDTRHSDKLQTECDHLEPPRIKSVGSMDAAFQQVDKWVEMCCNDVHSSLVGNDVIPHTSLDSDRAPLVCVTGSNYVVGAAMRSLQSVS